MPDTLPEEDRRRITAIVDARLSESEARQQAAMNEGFERVCSLIRSGFPDGDPAEHRKAHEQMIAAHRERADFTATCASNSPAKACWPWWGCC